MDEDGKHHNLVAEEAKYVGSWRFKSRYVASEQTYIVSARRKVWPLHSFAANSGTENEARAQLLSLMADTLGCQSMRVWWPAARHQRAVARSAA